jgi:magnesium transporter
MTSQADRPPAPHGVVVGPGGVLEEGVAPADVVRAARQAGTRSWLDFEGLTPEDARLLETGFGFHPLAIEDAQNPDTRPTVEEYDGFLFLVMRSINHAPGRRALDLVPVFAFLNERVLVTVHPGPLPGLTPAVERLHKHPDLLADGTDRLLHHLLDQVVDHYFPILEQLEERVDGLEDRVFQRPRPDVLAEIFAARKDIVVLRRSLGPLREVAANLMSGLPYVRGELRPFFRDVYDHVLRLLDELESERDILAGLLDGYLSQVNNRLSEVMKTLTALATVGLPFTIVSGYFGMNFERLPWIHAPWGVAAATALMIAVSVVLLLLFRWRRWL